MAGTAARLTASWVPAARSGIATTGGRVARFPTRRYGQGRPGRDAKGTGVCVADIFDEINDDLRTERMGRLLRRYGAVLAGVVLVAAGGAVGYQAWRGQQARANEAVAATYITALDAGPDGQAALDQIAATGPAGYSALARLQGGTLRARADDLPAALSDWERLAQTPSADPLMRDLATLLWAQRQVDSGPAEAIMARLQPLTAPTNPWRALALETQAWVTLRTGQTEQARLILAGLVVDMAAPEGVRGRANAMLAGLPLPGPPPSSVPTGSGG